MQNGEIGDIRTPKPLNRQSQNLEWVLTSAMSPRMPKFKAIAPVGMSWLINEIILSRGYLFSHYFSVTQILLASRG